MTTIGEQVLERINGIERRLDLYDRLGTAGGVGVPTDRFEALQEELQELKTKLADLNLAGPAGSAYQSRQSNTRKIGCPRYYPNSIESNGVCGVTRPGTG